MSSRKRWIGMIVRPVGEVVVDDGAARALCQGGKSLLPIGVVSVKGQFEPGDVVAIVDQTGRKIGQGLSHYSGRELGRIKGCRTAQLESLLGRSCRPEVVHRDNMVLTVESS